MRIDAYDAEIHFTDYSTRETVSIEGMAPKDVQQAILLYIHNLSIEKDTERVNVSWFEELKDKAEEAINRVQSNS